MKNEYDDFLYVSNRFLCRISEVTMPTLQQQGPTSRQHSPMTIKLSDKRVNESLIQVRTLAQSLLCSAACVAAHQDLVVQQVSSFLEEGGDGDNEGVEIEEESLLRKDYGIYRV